MSSKSKDNTCPKCSGEGKLAFGDTCPHCHGSGQQEDNTGHPTAQTPDAQPLENVSGEQLGKPVDILARAYDRVREVYLQQPMNDALGWALAEIADLDFPAMKEFGHLPEALPSNNTSESVRVDAPLTDSKPEKPQCTQPHCKCMFHLNPSCPNHHYAQCEPSKPDQLREILSNLPEIEQKPYYDAIQALLTTEYDRGKVEAYEDMRKSVIANEEVLGVMGLGYLEHIDNCLRELKSKGEVKSE